MEQDFVNKTFMCRGLFDSEGYLFCCAAIQEVPEVGQETKSLLIGNIPLPGLW